MDPLKKSITDALRVFVRQRPGLEYGNYGDPASYRAEVRSIGKDLKQAEQLLRAVELRDGITGEALLSAFRAFSGRLSCTATRHQYTAADCPGRPCSTGCDHIGGPWTVHLSYCTGQYFPTEYRRAVAAICAAALWDYIREQCMPAPRRIGDDHGRDVYLWQGAEYLSGGDWLRRYFRREFGRSIASRWFD